MNIYHCTVWFYVHDMYRALSINNHVCTSAAVQLYRGMLWPLGAEANMQSSTLHHYDIINIPSDW